MLLIQLGRAWPNLQRTIRANPQIHICWADREDSKLHSKYWLGPEYLFKLEICDNKVTYFCSFIFSTVTKKVLCHSFTLPLLFILCRQLTRNNEHFNRSCETAKTWVTRVFSDDNISLCKCLAEDLTQNPSGQCTQTVWMSLNATPSSHTHKYTTFQCACCMGAEACTLVWRPVLAKAHTSGFPIALWTADWAQRYQRASSRSTALLWTPLTGWFLMAENTYQRRRRLVFYWKSIYTGSFSVPSGIK